MTWINHGGFPEYISVAERKKRIEQQAKKLRSKNKHADFQPIAVPGRLMTKTFWGKAWCTNIESYADYKYRLERGRSYVRHGAVVDLKIYAGSVTALVCGTHTYAVSISIVTASKPAWQALIKECAGKINSLVELLQGKFSKHIMEILTQPKTGLFPKPAEITFTCSCPDYAVMCKHVAAVLYGIGVRLDHTPEHLFLLRSVDHTELLKSAVNQASFTTVPTMPLTGDLSQLFGIQIAAPQSTATPAPAPFCAINKRAPVRKTTPATKKG